MLVGAKGKKDTQVSTKGYMVVIARSTDIAPCPRTDKVARCLSSQGGSVLVIGWDREQRFPIRESLGGCLEVERLRLSGQYGGGLKNFWGLLRFNLNLLKRYWTVRPLVIHAIDLDTVLPALIAKWLFKARVIYDIADWYAVSRKVGLLAPLIEKLERWVVRCVDYVLLPDEARLQQIGYEPRKWAVIYNTPLEVPIGEEDGLPRPYFAYVGILHQDRGIEYFSASAACAGAHVVVAGYGPLASVCKAMTAQNPLVRFIGRVPYAKGLSIQAGAVGILALYDPRLSNNRLAAPNKLYEAMMLGKPIITSEGTLVAEIIKREGIGFAIPFGNSEKLATAMRYLVDHPEEARKMGSRARVLYEQRYSYKEQCRKLLNVYRAVAPSLFHAESETAR